MTARTANRSRELLALAADKHGWELASDAGYVVIWKRGLESMRVYFSDDDAERGRQIVEVLHTFPTGDRLLSSGNPAMDSRTKRARDAGKREFALNWFAETHYARPGMNALLAKMGFEPVLPEASA